MMLPQEFIDNTRLLMGEQRFEHFMEAIKQPAPVSIRLNPFKVSLAQPPYNCDGKVAWCDNGYYLKERPSFTFDPLLHAGAYYVQEASSMFVDEVVRQFVHHPVTVLDLCAAPGGKSLCIRAALPKGSLLYSNEPNGKRAQILAENVIKQGHPDVIVTSNYARDYQRAGLCFDVIFTDMPCSGEGMFRKDPDSVGEWSMANVANCAQLQRSILEDIWPCLVPGGLLVYSTCTYNAHENEQNIAYAVKELGAEVLPVAVSEGWGVVEALEGTLPACRFIPGFTRGEGLFLAVLRKPETQQSVALRTKKKVAAERALHVLAHGVRPAQEKGKKVIPDVSQALSIDVAINPYPRVDVDYFTAIAYLRHEAIVLPSAAPAGLVTICYRGIALGYAKNLGSRANNLYPQEWRIRSTHVPEIPQVLPFPDAFNI